MLPPIESSAGRDAGRGPSGRCSVVGGTATARLASPTVAVMAPDDATLLVQARAGDDRAFAALYHRHARYVAGVVYRLAGNDWDLDDVVEAAFCEAARSRGTLSRPESFRDRLLRFAIRRLNASLGRRRRRRWLAFAAGVFRVNRRLHAT